jgi:hypothetical protein
MFFAVYPTWVDANLLIPIVFVIPQWQDDSFLVAKWSLVQSLLDQ